MAKRGAYRSDCRAQLDALEAKREAAGITQNEWFFRAGISRATGQRILADGKAFQGPLNALSFALRELEKEKRREQQLFAEVAAA